MTIAARLRTIEDRLARAAESVGRDPAGITLIAVSKGQPIESLREVYDAGQRHFGESRLQEALPKIVALPPDVVWHFMGRLQSNKARRIAEVFPMIHTLENGRQLAEIARGTTTISGLIEINIAEEPQKVGISPNLLDSYAQEVLNCRQVNGKGLMTVGPAVEASEAMRPYFRRMRELAAGLSGCNWLSMGMSHDFEVAIQEGSTHIRIGTALFGTRA